MPDADTDTPAGRLRYWANVDEANRPMSDNTTAGYLTAPLERSDVRAVLADNERLTAELEKYTGWEPTVREEYEHACGQLATVSKVVEQFAAGDQLAVNQFVADLKNALELS